MLLLYVRHFYLFKDHHKCTLDDCCIRRVAKMCVKFTIYNPDKC